MHIASSANPQPDPEQDPPPQVLHSDDSLGPQAEPAGNVAVPAVDRNETALAEDDDGDVVAGPAIEAFVTLSKTHRKCFRLHGDLYSYNLTGCRVYAEDLTTNIDQPDFVPLIQQFLYTQDHSDSGSSTGQAVDNLPPFYEKVTVYPSAVATFYSPSDISGVGGMRYERIRAVDSWRKGPGRHDCVFVETDPDAPGMRGLDIARVRLFFSFTYNGIKYPCALVHWFSRVAESADRGTGMWVVEPDSTDDGKPFASVIHLDTIIRAAHLLPVYGSQFVSRTLSFTDTLNEFRSFYVNKYADHHAFEIAF